MCEMPECYRIDKPTARKEHKCCECRGKISIGEKYHKHSGVWNGRADAFKVCNDCEDIRAEVDKDEKGPEFKTAFGELYESVFNRGEYAIIKRYMDTKRKRGAEILPWMIEQELELSIEKCLG